MSGSNPQLARAVSAVPRRPRVLLAACGCVAAVKFGVLCQAFSQRADVRAIATKSSFHFLDKLSIPDHVELFFDEHERQWRRIGDAVVHIELARWADIMVIAPLSANTLAKIARGLCDNLLTRIVQSWEYPKQLFVAPSMNSIMWRHVLTENHCIATEELGITLIHPDGENSCSMVEPEDIFHFVSTRCFNQQFHE